MADDLRENPLTAGLEKTLHPQSCTLVIFGGSGDLSRRKLLPALYNLALDGLLPTGFAAVGFAGTAMTDHEFRAFAAEGVKKFSRHPYEATHWQDFEGALFYQQASFQDAKSFTALKSKLEQVESQRATLGNRIFYLAIPPNMIGVCVDQLQAAGLIYPVKQTDRFSRIVVEKPLGWDLETASKLNDELGRAFHENQIYRIDHYLGKETVQNILVMRFGNSIFEPLWNERSIDHVQITVAEEEGVGTRAGYYEGAGALRDIVQNHILQLLCMIAMEPPYQMNADVLRSHKLEVLRCLRPMTEHDLEHRVVRAQYTTGYCRGIEVPGYRNEKGVKPDSTTETYVALRAFVDNWRWAGVPFYLRTGKRMAKRATEITVQYKDVPRVLFNIDPADPLKPNALALRIQPDEGISLRISAKLPGPKVRIYPVKMDFRYGSTFGAEASPEAYERLLLEVMAGDQTLFMRRDEVEAAWQWVDSIQKGWERRPVKWLPEYAAGSWGPVEADRLIEIDGRKWRTL
jgi:glucose-6-phosphate 1-dehydrogenase